MQPPIGRLGTKAAPGGNATQLKKGKLEMGIREDFLAGRTAGLEKDPPGEGRGAPSRGTLETRRHNSPAALKEESL